MEREEDLAQCEMCGFISEASNVRRHIIQVHQSPVRPVHVVTGNKYQLEEFEVDGFSQNNEWPHFPQSQNQEVEYISFQEDNDSEMACGLNNENNEPEKIHWTTPQVRLLIRLYDQNKAKFKDKKTRNKNVWKAIAEELNRTAGSKFTVEQCDNKFKNLKKNYKKIKDNNSKSGRGAVSWPFFKEMDDIFSKDPDVTPLSTCSNLEGPSTSATHPIDEDNPEPSTSQRREINSRGVKRKQPPAEEPEWFKKFREECEERHKDRMERQDSLLKMLENFLKK